jgi:hypothetical protein
MGLENATAVLNPLDPSTELHIKSKGVSNKLLVQYQHAEYREGVGLLMYVAQGTRPDKLKSVTKLLQFLDAPRVTHLCYLRQVFWYLKGTRNLCLVLGGGDTTMTAYSDADWASKAHCHSISGYAMFVGVGAVS